MNRRTLLAALGTVGASGAIVTGTGAFTSVEADRDVQVRVADDANALLALEATDGPNGEYVDASDGTLGIDITGSDGDDATSEGAQGINPNALTLFEDVFQITNQGTQPVDVAISPLVLTDVSNDGFLAVLIVPSSSFPTVELGVGDPEVYSLVAFTVSDDPTDLGVDGNGNITVAAEADND